MPPGTPGIESWGLWFLGDLQTDHQIRHLSPGNRLPVGGLRVVVEHSVSDPLKGSGFVDLNFDSYQARRK